jgi:DNA-binding response OmpR family regulator
MRRVLVVDDDCELANLVALALRRQGYLVDVATSGADALERVRRTRFDIALVDWHMPIMDGATFLRELRRELGAAMPLMVVMSGMPGAAALARDLGADAFIEKPFRLRDLQALLERLVSCPEP